jgi:hypothetical protein
VNGVVGRADRRLHPTSASDEEPMSKAKRLIFWEADDSPTGRHQTGVIRVFAQGGFEIVEEIGPVLERELRTHCFPAPPDGRRRVGPDAGYLWAEAAAIGLGKGYTIVTIEEEA